MKLFNGYIPNFFRTKDKITMTPANYPAPSVPEVKQYHFSDNDELWIVGKWKSGGYPDSCVWEFGGVFTSEQKAIEACRDWTYFVAPMKLNSELPDETVEMKGVYYPIPNPDLNK